MSELQADTGTDEYSRRRREPRVASEPHTTYVTPQEFLAHVRQDDTPVAG